MGCPPISNPPQKSERVPRLDGSARAPVRVPRGPISRACTSFSHCHATTRQQYFADRRNCCGYDRLVIYCCNALRLAYHSVGVRSVRSAYPSELRCILPFSFLCIWIDHARTKKDAPHCPAVHSTPMNRHSTPLHAHSTSSLATPRHSSHSQGHQENILLVVSRHLLPYHILCFPKIIHITLIILLQSLIHKRIFRTDQTRQLEVVGKQATGQAPETGQAKKFQGPLPGLGLKNDPSRCVVDRCSLANW